VLTLPDGVTLTRCQERRSSDDLELYCTEMTSSEYIPYLLEDFDPHVGEPGDDAAGAPSDPTRIREAS